MLGFEVTFVDGGTFTEKDGTWDDVPRDRQVSRLSLTDLDSGEEHLGVDEADAYFFTNEAVSGATGQSTHSGKILGCAKGGLVTEARLELWPVAGARSLRTYPRSECPFAESAFRAGRQS